MANRNGPTILLERGEELAACRRLIETAVAGRGAVAVVEGQPGIGKTALLAAARELGERADLNVLVAAGRELEREFGFGVARQLLGPELARRGPQLLSGAAQHAAPALAFGDGAPGSLPATLHGLYWLLAGLAAERPLLLAVDDAQWADEASLRFLAYLAARLDGMPVALLLATRDDRASAALVPLAELAATPGTELVRLLPLSRAAIREIAGTTLGESPAENLVAAVETATAGNPFLVVELLRHRSEEILEHPPDTVARAITTRLDTLSDEARALAEAVAVLGRDEERRAAAMLAGLPSEVAAAAADSLADAAILAPGTALAFAHPLVRQVVYEGIPAGARGAAHARAAWVLDELGAPAEAVAAHLLEAPPDGSAWAVERLREAAAIAGRRGAPGAGVALLRRALRERHPPSAALLAELAELEALSGDPAAPARYAAAEDAATDPGARTALALTRGRLLFFGGRLDEALAALDAAATAPSARELRLQIAAELLAVDRVRRDPGFALPPGLEFPPEELRGASAGERALLAGFALDRLMTRAPAVELARRALASGAALAEDGAASPTALNAVTVLMLADELDEVDELLERAEDEAQQRGDVAGHAATLTFRSHAAFRRGAVLAALEDARDALALTQAHGLAVLTSFALVFQLDALAETDAGAAEELLSSFHLDGELPDLFTTNAVLARRGRVRLLRDRPAEALDDLLEAGRRLRRARIDDPSFGAWRSEAALALATLDRGEEGRRLAEEELALAREVGRPRAIGIALRALAHCADPDPIPVLQDAVATLAASPDRLQEAYALADLGAALRAGGSPADAREPLRQALDQAARLGATALAARARDELLATGARPRRTALSGVAALTPAELRCARLAAEGLSNRDIAQRLFVTIRAVELHLTATYRKLEIASRTELQEALADPAEQAAQLP